MEAFPFFLHGKKMLALCGILEMKKTLIILIWFFASSCQKNKPLLPTYVEGVVIDKDTRMPIENATVSINMGNTSYSMSSIKSLQPTFKDGSFSGSVLFTSYFKSFIKRKIYKPVFDVTADAEGYQRIQNRNEESLLGENYAPNIEEGKRNNSLKIELMKFRNVTFRFVDQDPITPALKVRLYIEELFIDQGSHKFDQWKNGLYQKNLSGADDHLSFIMKNAEYRVSVEFFFNSGPSDFSVYHLSIVNDREIMVYY